MHLRELRTLVYPHSKFNPEDWLRFVQLSSFERRWSKLGLDDDDLRGLEMLIMLHPKKHPVISGSGGLRKMRFNKSDSNRGKRGSYRVCYVYFEEYGIVLLVIVFAKNEKGDLTAEDTNQVAALIKDIQHKLDTGEIR